MIRLNEPYIKPYGWWTPLKALAMLPLIAALIYGLYLIDADQKRDWRERNLDPRAGKVKLTYNDARYKICDGPTLLYYSAAKGGWAVSAVPNSPECAP